LNKLRTNNEELITDCLVKDLEAFRRQKGLYKQRSVD